MTLRRRTFLTSLLIGAIGSSDTAFARQTVPETAARPKNLLDLIRYDPRMSGPLIQLSPTIVPPLPWSESLTTQLKPYPMMTPDQFAERLQARLLTIGTMSALVPRSMTVIADHPSAANPFVGMEPAQRLQILLSLLTPEQWQIAGSVSGIGVSELTDDQRALFLGLLPAESLIVNTMYLVKGEKREDDRYEAKADPESIPVANIRLRLVRHVTYQCRPVGKDAYFSYFNAGGSIPSITRHADGSETMLSTNADRPAGDPQDEPGTITAFGVPILRTLPNRAKNSELLLDSPVLQVAVRLEESLGTVRDLLARISSATHLNLVADGRLAAIPIALRLKEGGQDAMASDIVATLCRSVTGAFRRIDASGGASIYLLTDDVEGIGTRSVRLGQWAADADEIRRDAVQKAQERTAISDPLSHIRFAPDDPYALPPALLEKIDAAYRAARYADDPEFDTATLPVALRDDITKQTRDWPRGGLQTDRVRIGTRLEYQYILPDNRVIASEFPGWLPINYLQTASAVKSKGAAKTKAVAAPPTRFPASLRQRILLVNLPTDEARVDELLALARPKGMTDIWFDIPLSEAASAAKRLIGIIARHTKSGPRIGAAVSWLKRAAAPPIGVPDVNLLGETGEQWIGEMAIDVGKRHSGYADVFHSIFAPLFSGWVVPDVDTSQNLLRPLARVPHLSALLLKATAAPGWTEDGSEVTSYLFPGGYLGYTPDVRIACLRAEGFDPIDVPDMPSVAGKSLDLPLFPSSGMSQRLSRFRFNENKRQLAHLYQMLKESAPSLPLYLDDRVSPYSPSGTAWYPRWESPERIPIPVYDQELPAAAFRVSSELLLGHSIMDMSQFPFPVPGLGSTVDRAVKEHWSGLVVDVSRLSLSDALKTLDKISDDPANTR